MKQKKTLIIIAVVLLILAVFGVVYLKPKNNSINNSTESKSVFTSIKDALSKNMTLVCDFTDETGSSVKSYVKNGAVRVTTSGASENQSGEVIILNKKMYMWNTKTKTGFLYNIPDSDESEVGMKGEDVIKSEAYLDMIDKYKDSCKAAAVEDSYFEVPTDINFQDMSKLLEDIKNNGSYSFN